MIPKGFPPELQASLDLDEILMVLCVCTLHKMGEGIPEVEERDSVAHMLIKLLSEIASQAGVTAEDMTRESMCYLKSKADVADERSGNA